MIQDTKSKDTVQTAIRLPRALRDAIKVRANGLGRSINTHVVMTMQEDVNAQAPTGEHVPRGTAE